MKIEPNYLGKSEVEPKGAGGAVMRVESKWLGEYEVTAREVRRLAWEEEVCLHAMMQKPAMTHIARKDEIRIIALRRLAEAMEKGLAGTAKGVY